MGKGESADPGVVIYIPQDLWEFKKNGVEPLIIVVIRNGVAVLPIGAPEDLQEQFGGELDIFTGTKDVIITIPFGAGKAGRLKNAIEKLLETKILAVKAGHKYLNEVARVEIGSSL